MMKGAATTYFKYIPRQNFMAVPQVVGVGLQIWRLLRYVQASVVKNEAKLQPWG
jgi:hypothetical protein